MSACRICGKSISFMSTSFKLENQDPISGETCGTIEVCAECAADMRRLKNGDEKAYNTIHSYMDRQDDVQLKEFIVCWETPPESILQQRELELEKRNLELSKILISSGFSFEGHKIVKYSGYISGDDVTQLPRSGIFGSDNGKKLTDALVKIRQNALRELKEAAYALGCNAIIGVDFDYITLEPETANIVGGTLYEPYLICVTANGNAVVIEKE